MSKADGWNRQIFLAWTEAQVAVFSTSFFFFQFSYSFARLSITGAKWSWRCAEQPVNRCR